MDLTKIKGFIREYYVANSLVIELEDIYEVQNLAIKQIVKELNCSIIFRSGKPIDIKKLKQKVKNIKYIDEISKKVYVSDINNYSVKEIYYETVSIMVEETEYFSALSKQIVNIFRNNRQQIQTFRKELGLKIFKQEVVFNKWILFTGLGGAKEVGRSAYLIRTANSRILIDCGVKVVNGETHWPYLHVDELDLEKLDAIIITHAHADHCIALPCIFSAGYRGPVYMTSATQKLVAAAHLDFFNISELTAYTVEDVKVWLKKCILLQYNKWYRLTSDILLNATSSAHILGSTMLSFKIYDKYLLHTSDFRLRPNDILPPVALPVKKYNYMITEGTYFNSKTVIPTEEEVIEFFRKKIVRLKQNAGHVLIPVLAMGRGHDILNILDKIFTKYPELITPVYLDGRLNLITQIYAEEKKYLNASLRCQIESGHNPFHKPYIFSVVNRYEVLTTPSIIISTSGMFEGGPILYWLNELCQKPSTQIIIVTAQLTPTGKSIKNKEPFISFCYQGEKITKQLLAEVDSISYFSGHAIEQELINMVKTVNPEYLLITHVDPKNVQYIIKQKFFKNFRIPSNLETYRLL